MIAKYKRTARTFSELSLGDLDPLVDALPELRQPATAATVGPPSEDVSQPWAKGGPPIANPAEKRASPTGFEPVLQP
jgi:hypothetical protein